MVKKDRISAEKKPRANISATSTLSSFSFSGNDIHQIQKFQEIGVWQKLMTFK